MHPLDELPLLPMPSILEIVMIEKYMSRFSSAWEMKRCSTISSSARSYRLESPTLVDTLCQCKIVFSGRLSEIKRHVARRESPWFRLALCSRTLPRSRSEYHILYFRCIRNAFEVIALCDVPLFISFFFLILWYNHLDIKMRLNILLYNLICLDNCW